MTDYIMKEKGGDKMKVKLVNQMGTVEDISNIASICYGKEKASNPRRLFENLIKLGHTSVLEHMVFTFKIDGISRACLSQLTRHRMASYTVRSQRYCNESKTSYYLPKTIEFRSDVEKHIDDTFKLYDKLIDEGIKREDARMLLPNAIDTSLYMTINLRSLLNFFILRLDKSAQEEIRQLADKMYLELDMELRKIITPYLKENIRF